MFQPTQARLKIVVGAPSRSVARLQTICCLADSTLSASLLPWTRALKKNQIPRGALIIPPPNPPRTPNPVILNTCRCELGGLLTGLWWRSLNCVFLRSAAAAAAAISRLFICSANTANTGFTAASACLRVLVAGSRKANFEIGLHRTFFARARRACCGSLMRADAKWLEFQKKGFCIFRSKILAFIITIKMSLKFETEQIKIHEVKRRHFSACGWGGEKPLKDVFTSTPFELQLRAFNLAAAAAAQNNPLHLLKRPPTLNKPLPFFAVLHI